MQRRHSFRGVEIVAEGFEHGAGEGVRGRAGVASGCGVAERSIERIQTGLGLFEQRFAPNQILPVVAGQQGVAQGLAVVAPQQLADRLDVAFALGHLAAADGEHAVVQPIAHAGRAAVDAAALGALVFVVGESQIAAAAVNVDDRPQVLVDHGRALDVPAGAAAPPRTVPAGQIRRRRLPEHEILGVFLVRRDFDAGAVAHLLEGALRQRAVFRVRRHVEQHVGTEVGLFGGIVAAHRPLCHVGVLLADQVLDHGDDLVDVGGRAGRHVRRRHPQGGDVFVVVGGEALGQAVYRLAGLPGRGIDLVVHIGDVAHVLDLRIGDPQQAHENIESDRRHAVADMRQVVDRGTADVDAHFVRMQRHEGLFAAGAGVVQVDSHRLRAWRWSRRVRPSLPMAAG